MKLLNEILKTALIFLLVTLMWFVNIDVSKDDSLPRMIVGIILTNPPIKVIATIWLLISLFDIWYDPQVIKTLKVKHYGMLIIFIKI